MADLDIAAEAARLEKALAVARAAYQADTADEYVKLQYRGAQEALVRFRQFWRGVDASVDMSDPDYGLAGRGPQGRRGGVIAHTDDNTKPEG